VHGLRVTGGCRVAYSEALRGFSHLACIVYVMDVQHSKNPQRRIVMQHILLSILAALLSSALTIQYFFTHAPASPPPQTICSTMWQPQVPTSLIDINFVDEGGVLYPITALPDTGASVTLVASCVLEQLEARGLAHRTVAKGGYGDAAGSSTETPVWEVTFVLYPYQVKTRVLEHYNNVAPVILGRDVLGSVHASVAVLSPQEVRVLLPE